MGRRVRAALITLSSAPWRRAPWLLVRRPGVLATVAGATAVLAASLGAVPLFVSSVGTASVAVQAAERCPRDTGVTYGQAVGALSDEDSSPFGLLGDRLGPAVVWAHMEASLVPADGSRATPVAILTRDGALDHVDVIDGSPGPGLWVSDRITDKAGLRAGDRAVLLGGNAPRPVDLPIAGVYRDVTGTVLDDFWCSHGDLLLLQGIEPVPPPPVLLTDRATFDELVAGLDVRQVQRAWEAPLGDDLTLAAANGLVDDLTCDAYELAGPNWCAAVLNSGGAITFGTGATQTRYRDAEDFMSRFFRSALPFVTERARGIQTSVRGGVWPVAGFAALAGVGLVGAAAALWFDRRRREVTILTVRGVSPAGLGVKAVLELALALAVGSAAGVGLAYGIVLWLGPSQRLEPAALRQAALAGVLAAVAAALTVGMVVAGRVRTHHARRPRWAWLRVVPWELVLGATALLSYRAPGRVGCPGEPGCRRDPGRRARSVVPTAVPGGRGGGRDAVAGRGAGAAADRQPHLADGAVPGDPSGRALPGGGHRPGRGRCHRSRCPRLCRHPEPLPRRHARRQGEDLHR
jgi:putative ABC transport system permease protein